MPPPCHFGVPEEFTTCPHSFKKKDFKKHRVCGVCRQTIDGQGIACRTCKYSCHKKCEAQVVTTCSAQVHLDQVRFSDSFGARV
ncbi:tensin-2-like isoform X2 [Rattus rattus]|uniref:tensin-2-like isoform X2 n=1 Tax=Rattus rattus TaxID=10117 RepID=UPI0013F34597|nr:tensin-2-like isoform X2 [Rattus rattus]